MLKQLAHLEPTVLSVRCNIRWKGQQGGDDDDDHGECPPPKPSMVNNEKEKKPAKKMKPGQPKKKAGRQRQVDEPSLPCLYKPGEFKDERKRFIEEQGFTVGSREGNRLWKESERRAELLRYMPHNELVRRRFIPPANPGCRGRAKKAT